MKVSNLTKIYVTEYDTVKALNNMSIDFPTQGLVFIVGVSGSGKSTLMNMLSGVDVPSEGDVIVNGRSIFKENKNKLFGYRNSYVGLIFQDYNLIEDMNVYDNIKLPLELLGRTDFSIIDEIIKKVDIEDIKYSSVKEISSGQMQRVAIARALVKNSTMILADEPTGNLDSKNTKIVMNLLKEISKDRLVIVITHDDEAAEEYGDRIIAIEDGTVLNDTVKNPEVLEQKNDLEETTEIVDPKIKFGKQIEFTKNFILHNIGRSLAIFLLIILIPFIGAIMCGYVFYDVSTAFATYQKEYGCEFVELSSTASGYSVVYSDSDDSLEYFDMVSKYMSTVEGSKLIEVYGINYFLSDIGYDDSNEFYKAEVNNLILDNGTFTCIEGEMPSEDDEIAITDYLNECFYHYTDNYKEIGDTISINGVRFKISGIVKTSFVNFRGYDSTDLYTSMAFNENLMYYNAFYVNLDGKNRWWEEMTYYVENAKFMVMSQSQYESSTSQEVYITIRKKTSYSPTIIAGTSNFNKKYGAISKAFWTELLRKNFSDAMPSSTSVSFVCHSRAKYTFSFRATSVYDSNSTTYECKSPYELICSEDRFEQFKDKQKGCRFLVRLTDNNYKEILNNENVQNQSFSYAKVIWDKAESTKYVMIEFLLTFILITFVFSFIINSMTMNVEKKKIGIEYSFGIKKGQIIVPYLLEIILYIVIGFILSYCLTRFVFPWFMTQFIYNTAQERMEYYFFYISNGSLLGWSFVIYFIIIFSLLVMVYKICKKSPIEIIKDL